MGFFPSIKSIPIVDLIPYANNSRTHSDAQVAQIAASIKEFGFANPVLLDGERGIIAGHGRVLAARKLGLDEVPCIELKHLTKAQRKAYIIADNKLALNAGWDEQMLALELGALKDDGFDLDLTGFSADELDALLNVGALPEGLTDEDAAPEVQAEAVSQPGDIWLCGPHRVMCGDSTRAADVGKLMSGHKASLLHADPPYGMGKESDGVENDNLDGDKLDAFQMQWWNAFRPFLMDNSSAYIWGNAPELWRLWYLGGLGDSEKLELRNELVWDKKSVQGMRSPALTQYPEASERCLFFQLGDQFLGSINSADFPGSWEPLRSYMESCGNAAGIKPDDIKRVCGCGMYAHWFTRSQFQLIPEKHYKALQTTYAGRFTRSWADLKSEWDRVQKGRSYFDNAHDAMRDTWDFDRVIGDDRHGHATPKPVDMMKRVMLSSLPEGGLCAEPFGGSGSTLIGAEKTNRRCFSMELQAIYVDVIVKRWQDFTGKQATLESDGRTFTEITNGRPAPISANA